MSIITVDIEKYRAAIHEQRRFFREEEFRPYDEIIMKQIPGNASVQAEASRQAIREKYAALQLQIDAAKTVEELKTFYRM